VRILVKFGRSAKEQENMCENRMQSRIFFIYFSFYVQNAKDAILLEYNSSINHADGVNQMRPNLLSVHSIMTSLITKIVRE
jgi:hypothetical protein